MQSRFRVRARDQPEIRIIDARDEVGGRCAGLGMIQHIQRIDTKLDGFGFAHLQGLAHVRIKAPLSGAFESTETGIASSSG